MANINSIHSVCNSLIRFLHQAYEAHPLPGSAAATTMQDAYPCNFRVLASGELKAGADFGTTLSLYLYRVLLNEHLRGQPVSRNGVRPPLSVDLHFLLTIWSESAAAEQTICAWAMQQLHEHPIMDLSSLSREGGWGHDDVIQIIPAELSNEDLMRIWDALAPDYRLSLSYIARVVRIDPLTDPQGLPVVATRYQYQEKNEHRE
ncbi:DUF4255 domain-containing protein [Desulfurivibrio sp. D14AmB]|uniref:DUF4255 domain-containing protein n=1 Tax=Desulfurivibrio sp. D14AmB TaxID=3374370 RepID=UPI00376F415F